MHRTVGMKTRFMLALLLLASVTAGFADPKPQPRPDFARELLKMVNQERTDRGVPPLAWSDELARSAAAHGELVAAHHSLEHHFPGEPGLMERIAAAGAHFNAVAENLAYAESAQEIHSGLMGSPGHRRNLLNPDYDAVGIAVLQVGDRLYAVQNFAHLTPKVPYLEAERQLADRFNQLRRKAGLSPAHFEADTQLREAACHMAAQDHVSAADLPRPTGVRNLVAFTASAPTELPDRLTSAIDSPTLGVMRIGACYRASPHYPGGVYWFGVVY